MQVTGQHSVGRMRSPCTKGDSNDSPHYTECLPVRVLLVYPGLDFEIAYPLGLAYIAAALALAGHEVIGYDAGLDGMSGLGSILDSRRPEAVGLAVWSPGLARAREAAALVRRRGLRLLIGGPHVTVDPEGAMALTGAEAGVIGEGERSAPALLAAWERGAAAAEIPGLILPGGRSPPRAPERDLDALPVADRSVFDPRRYPHTWAAAAPRAAAVVTSRGCPRACAHCPAPALYRGRWRPRGAAAVLGELRELAERGFGHVLIEDEHPTADRRRWLALCEALAEARLPLSWSCPNGLRPESLDRELLAAMARAGCSRIALGLESADPALLARLGRHPDPGRAREVVRWARREGIEVTAYFMIGLPGEGALAPLQVFREATRLGVSGAHFSLFQPLPGSALSGAPAAPARLARVRAAMYAGFYAHPLRLRAALRASGASAADLPRALRRLRGWLRYGRRHAGLG